MVYSDKRLRVHQSEANPLKRSEQHIHYLYHLIPKAMTKAMTIIDTMQVNTMPKNARNDDKLQAENMNKNTPTALKSRPSMSHSQSGFTLIEIMVVIVILALMAFLVVPNVVGQSDKARKKTTQITLSSISNVLDQYRADNGRYPTTAQGLEALTTPPADAKNYPEGGYIKGNYPIDGWENELQYVSPGSEGRPYDLFSLGADGQQGGEGQDADIYAQL